MPPNLIEWRDEFRIGLPEVDMEHRALIGVINHLHRDLVVGASLTRVSGALAEIHVAIAAHFALEEKTMAAIRYDELAAHRADHERLLDEILDVLDEVTATAHHDPGALSSRLSAWFMDHFRTFDARFHRWLVDRGKGRDDGCGDPAQGN